MNSTFGCDVSPDVGFNSEYAFCLIAENADALRESVSKYLPESALRVRTPLLRP